jgi:hypothetical protein
LGGHCDRSQRQKKTAAESTNHFPTRPPASPRGANV